MVVNAGRWQALQLDLQLMHNGLHLLMHGHCKLQPNNTSLLRQHEDKSNKCGSLAASVHRCSDILVFGGSACLMSIMPACLGLFSAVFTMSDVVKGSCTDDCTTAENAMDLHGRQQLFCYLLSVDPTPAISGAA